MKRDFLTGLEWIVSGRATLPVAAQVVRGEKALGLWIGLTMNGWESPASEEALVEQLRNLPVRARRAEWLKVYGAAKLLSESVLRLHDKTQFMPEVFDDLAETHRVPGVSDHTDEPEAPAPAAPT